MKNDGPETKKPLRDSGCPSAGKMPSRSRDVGCSPLIPRSFAKKRAVRGSLHGKNLSVEKTASSTLQRCHPHPKHVVRGKKNTNQQRKGRDQMLQMLTIASRTPSVSHDFSRCPFRAPPSVQSASKKRFFCARTDDPNDPTAIVVCCRERLYVKEGRDVHVCFRSSKSKRY